MEVGPCAGQRQVVALGEDPRGMWHKSGSRQVQVAQPPAEVPPDTIAPGTGEHRIQSLLKDALGPFADSHDVSKVQEVLSRALRAVRPGPEVERIRLIEDVGGEGGKTNWCRLAPFRRWNPERLGELLQHPQIRKRDRAQPRMFRERDYSSLRSGRAPVPLEEFDLLSMLGIAAPDRLRLAQWTEAGALD